MRDIGKTIIWLGGTALAISLGAIAVVRTQHDQPDPIPITPSTFVTTTTQPTTSTSNKSVDELLKELDSYEAPPGELPGSIDLATYNSFTVGMTEAKFLEKASAACTKSVEAQGGSIYQCHGSGSTGANALFQFQNGKLISKSQFGLSG